MDTNLLRQRQRQRQQQQQQQQQMNSTLMRYRSAPSSLIATLMEGEVEGCDDFIPTSTNHHRSSSPEAETMFARFMTSCADSGSPDLREMEEKFPQANGRSSKYLNSIEHHGGVEQSKYSSPTRGGSQQMIYRTPPQQQQQQQQQQQPPQMLNHNSVVGENAYRVANPMAQQQVKMSGPPSASVGAAAASSSNLIRHSSSPAGLFSHLTVENGFAVMRGIGNSRGGNGTNGEVAASNSRLKGQINFNSGTPSSSGIMSQISEIGSESMGASSVDGGSLGNGNNSNHYMPTFPISSWDDSPLENFSGIKRDRDSSSKMMSGLNSSEAQNGEGGNRPGLSHHYSLPKNSAEMAAILQFQDSVPCKIRAKRGCATHPRSIAERVRRTRISERMRKLQELVPNMDKQTNTADMLDLAVEHIKDLQKQVKTLNDGCAKCTCSSKQKPYQNPRA